MGDTRQVRLGELVFDVRVVGPEGGTPVVLLHGFPETGRSWAVVATALAAEGYRVIIPNQRGYSPGARPLQVSDYDISLLAADVTSLLDALGIESAHLAGHDWGASVGWYLAAHHAPRILSFTAFSVPHLAAFGWALREDADQRARSAYMTLFRQPGKAEEVLLADDAARLRALYGAAVEGNSVNEYVALFETPGTLTAALNWYRAMTRAFGELPSVSVPTTYVWSTGDTAIGRAAAERCGEHVTGDYRGVELEGVSHWIPEEAPDAAASAILERIGVAGVPPHTLLG